MQQTVGVCLFRNDLRLHDNPALISALKAATTTHIIPVFVFDPSMYDITSVTSLTKPHPPALTWYNDMQRSSTNRTRFLVESVLDLRRSLHKLGSNLLIQFGHSDEALKSLVDELHQDSHHVAGIYYSKEFTHEEINIERKIANATQAKMFKYYSSTLFHPNDLPFSIENLPDVYSNFRTKVENVRDESAKLPLLTVEKMKPFPELKNLADLLSLTDEQIMVQMKVASVEKDSRSAFPFSGGETAGLARVKDYYWGTNAVKTYKTTRNGLIGHQYSTKFSPWLANGCISPRTVISLLTDYEEQFGANKDTYWVWFELLWRDYFKFVALKFKSKLFMKSGLMSDVVPKWQSHPKNVQAWINGQTGCPFVDANMRELKATGFMSNRGRQNVASYFIKDLKLDWTIGAEWFESQLLDHDPASNYGNWLYTAGLGNDPREDRHFNMIKQAKDYDPQGDYVKLWCPELRDIPSGLCQTPWKMSGNEQKNYNCVLGKDYPHPIVVVPSWEKHSGRTADTGKSGENPAERVFVQKKISKNRQNTANANAARANIGGGGQWKRDE